MTDRTESERLSLLRLPMICAVVFIHAFSLAGPAPADPNSITQLLVSQGFARLAVPAFFLMAGFFLYEPGPVAAATYAAKLKTRARTLLVPLLLWNAITLAFFAAAQAHPSTARYFSGATVIANFGPLDYLNAMLGVVAKPIAYQFWFIRDLLIAVLLSPLLLAAVRRAPALLLAVLAGVWMFPPEPYPIPTPESLLFVSVGLWCRARGLSLFALDRWAPLLAVVYLLLIAATPLYFWEPHGLKVQNLGMLLGLPVLLWLTGIAHRAAWLREPLLRYASASFFVFAAHEPLLTVFKKLLPLALPSPLAVYLLAPLVLVALLLVLHGLLSKPMPRVMGLLAGGR